VAGDLADQPEAVRAQQDDVEAAVVELLDADDLAEAADLVQRRLIVLVEAQRLDHPDPRRAVDRVAHHLAVARLENVQRKLRAREQDRPRKRENRDGDGSAHVNSSAESRRRCALDHGSSRPCASISWRKRLRAAPSFHSRSRRTISSKASAAASRSPAAISAPASSNRVAWSSGSAASRSSSGAVSTFGADASSRAARARLTSGFAAMSAGTPSRVARASSSSPAPTRARTRPPTASGLSGAISWICLKTLAARGGSPSVRICSAIASKGAISASTAAPSPAILSWASSWSSAFFS